MPIEYAKSAAKALQRMDKGLRHRIHDALLD